MSLSYQQMKIAVPLVIKAGNVPSIVGEAGIGKSALVEEIAASMGAKLYTTVVSLSEKGGPGNSGAAVDGALICDHSALWHAGECSVWLFRDAGGNRQAG